MYALTVRRPEGVQLKACQLSKPMRLSARSWNNPDVPLLREIAVRYKRDPLPVRRIGRLFVFTRSKGQLPRLAAGRGNQPDLVPVSFLQNHGERAAVR